MAEILPVRRKTLSNQSINFFGHIYSNYDQKFVYQYRKFYLSRYRVGYSVHLESRRLGVSCRSVAFRSQKVGIGDRRATVSYMSKTFDLRQRFFCRTV